jgi:hypothetical protein
MRMAGWVCSDGYRQPDRYPFTFLDQPRLLISKMDGSHLYATSLSWLCFCACF